jgi:hypothetical protein
MHDAPADWVTFVDEFSDVHRLTVDRSGPSMGFDHFLDRTADDPGTATFFGMAMRPPDTPRLRIVPIVAPAPVFAWSAMWRRRTAEPFADLLRDQVEPGAGVPLAHTRNPELVWLPAADRAWLATC